MQISKSRFYALLVAAALCGALVAGLAAYFATKPDYSPTANAAELVSGELRKLSGFDNRTYACKAGYKAVQVPIGKTVLVDGANFLLTEERPDRAQTSVKVEVGLPAGNMIVPTMIVATADKQQSPTLTSNTPVQIELAGGSTGSWSLATGTYTQIETVIGITDITFCVGHRDK